MEPHESDEGPNDDLLARMMRLRKDLGDDPALMRHIQTTIKALTTSTEPEPELEAPGTHQGQ